MFRAPEATARPGCRRLLTGADRQAYPAQSNLIQRSRKRILETHSSVFIEAVLSPAKYALFQILGACFLQLSPCPLAPKSYALSAKTGAFGGIIVTIFYFLLVVMRNSRLPPDPHVEQNNGSKGIARSAMILLHEMLYSVLASAVGSIAYSWSSVYRVELGIHIFAGCIGPILFLCLLSSSVVVIWCALWSHKKFMDWYTGYL